MPSSQDLGTKNQNLAAKQNLLNKIGRLRDDISNYLTVYHTDYEDTIELIAKEKHFSSMKEANSVKSQNDDRKTVINHIVRSPKVIHSPAESLETSSLSSSRGREIESKQAIQHLQDSGDHSNSPKERSSTGQSATATPKSPAVNTIENSQGKIQASSSGEKNSITPVIPVSSLNNKVQEATAVPIRSKDVHSNIDATVQEKSIVSNVNTPNEISVEAPTVVPGNNETENNVNDTNNVSIVNEVMNTSENNNEKKKSDMPSPSSTESQQKPLENASNPVQSLAVTTSPELFNNEVQTSVIASQKESNKEQPKIVDSSNPNVESVSQHDSNVMAVERTKRTKNNTIQIDPIRSVETTGSTANQIVETTTSNNEPATEHAEDIQNNSTVENSGPIAETDTTTVNNSVLPEDITLAKPSVTLALTKQPDVSKVETIKPEKDSINENKSVANIPDVPDTKEKKKETLSLSEALTEKLPLIKDANVEPSSIPNNKLSNLADNKAILSPEQEQPVNNKNIEGTNNEQKLKLPTGPANLQSKIKFVINTQDTTFKETAVPLVDSNSDNKKSDEQSANRIKDRNTKLPSNSSPTDKKLIINTKLNEFSVKDSNRLNRLIELSPPTNSNLANSVQNLGRKLMIQLEDVLDVYLGMRAALNVKKAYQLCCVYSKRENVVGIFQVHGFGMKLEKVSLNQIQMDLINNYWGNFVKMVRDTGYEEQELKRFLTWQRTLIGDNTLSITNPSSFHWQFLHYKPERKSRLAYICETPEKINISAGFYCKHYCQNGECPRGIKCKFRHDNHEIAMCKEMFYKRVCRKETKLTHQSRQNTRIIPQCLFDLRGECRFTAGGAESGVGPEYCRHMHNTNARPDYPICIAFAYYDWCENGYKCRFPHVWECPNQYSGIPCVYEGCSYAHRPLNVEQRKKIKPLKDLEANDFLLHMRDYHNEYGELVKDRGTTKRHHPEDNEFPAAKRQLTLQERLQVPARTTSRYGDSSSGGGSQRWSERLDDDFIPL